MSIGERERRCCCILRRRSRVAAFSQPKNSVPPKPAGGVSGGAPDRCPWWPKHDAVGRLCGGSRLCAGAAGSRLQQRRRLALGQQGLGSRAPGSRPRQQGRRRLSRGRSRRLTGRFPSGAVRSALSRDMTHPGGVTAGSSDERFIAEALSMSIFPSPDVPACAEPHDSNRRGFAKPPGPAPPRQNLFVILQEVV